MKVVWTREEDIQHDMYRPYWFDRISAGLDEQGRPVAWKNRFAGSSVIARWLPPAFKDGLDPDSTEGAIDLVYDVPNFHVEYVRVEPPGIPTAFWRSVGPSHNVFVTESFIDELAAAAKQDPVAYRRALLDQIAARQGRARACRGKGRLGTGRCPSGGGRGVSLQSVFGSYLAQVAEVEVSKDGACAFAAWSARSIAASSSIPTRSQAQIQSADHLRRHRRALWRDHAEERPRRADQLRHLPDAAHERGAGRSRSTS